MILTELRSTIRTFINQADQKNKDQFIALLNEIINTLYQIELEEQDEALDAKANAERRDQ